MREILFRGKCKRGYDYSDGDGWVYGSLLQKGTSVAIVKTEDIDICPKTDDGYSSIDDFGCIPVEENTIGQYTGLTDKNGTKIFEGDIIKYYEYIEGVEEITIAGYVVYSECGFYVKGANSDDGWRLCDLEPKTELEVVGNIHDNKDLLK